MSPGHARFTKTERLLRRREFLFLSRQGSSTANHYFVAAYRSNGLGFSRLGITVTRKVGNAVVRNRIKRLVREHFRQNRRLQATGIDLNVIAKKSAAGANNSQVSSALRHLFEKLGGHTD